MSMSTFPIGCPESAEQSLCPELSDELTMALAAGEWWGTVEAGETPCPTSLKSMKQNKAEGAPVPTRSQQESTVHASSKKLNLTSSLAFKDASEKALNSDTTLKSTEQQRKWRQKKPQEATVAVESPQKAPVPTGSPQGATVPQSLRRPPVPAPKVLACSSHRAPMPEKVPDRRKLNISELLSRQERLQQQKPQAPSLQGKLPDNILKRPKIPEPLRRELLQQRPQASSPRGAPIPDKTSKKEKLEVPELLRRELLQQKPQASLQGTLPDNISKRQKLKIPEPLRRELLQQRPQASSLQGAPVPDKTANRKKLEVPEPLKLEMLQQKSVCCAQGSPVPDKVPEKRYMISELLRKELVQQKPQANKPLPDRTPVGASEHARIPQVAAVPARNPQAAAVPSGAPIPKGALVHSGTSQGSLVPADSPKLGESLRIPKQQRQKQREQQGQQRQQNIPKGASVSPKISQSVLVPPCSQQGASGFQQEALMASMAPQDAHVPVNLSPFLQGTPKGAAVPGRTINQGKYMMCGSRNQVPLHSPILDHPCPVRIIDYAKKGETNEKSMKMADFWLTEKDLIPKLFKVLAVRFENQTGGYTHMARIPNRENLDHAAMAVLEYKGNPFPPLSPMKRVRELSLVNQLLKGYREEKAQMLAEKKDF
ncbi:hypothetical protein PO909_009406 [Leuciscus waleckii]